MLKVSIITVCYNESNRLRKTIKSVCDQTYSDIEHIIIDGGSISQTLCILQEYSHNENIKIYSEKDFGIYNAMNRGITKASGEFVLFLNAGDLFYNEHVVENMVSHMKNHDTIYYGKTCLIYMDGLKQIQDFTKTENLLTEKIYNGDMPCHQSIFSPRMALINHPFKEKLQIRADFEWLLYSLKNGYKCRGIPIIISYYEINGMSARLRNNTLLYQETQTILNEYRNKDFEDEYWMKIKLNQGASIRKYASLFRLMSCWFALKQKNINIFECFTKMNYKHVAIYGMSHMGLRVLEELKEQEIKVDYVIDKNIENISSKIKAVSPDSDLEKVDVIIVTAVGSFNEIKGLLSQKVTCSIISLEDLIYNRAEMI